MKYELSVHGQIGALCTMKCRKTAKAWTCHVGETSVILIQSLYDRTTWNKIFGHICNLYDRRHPQHPKTISKLRSELTCLITDYIESNSEVLGECPIIKGEIGNLKISHKSGPYFEPPKHASHSVSLNVSSNFQELCCELADHIEEGLNFLRVEASEILAFVATDCQRVSTPGFPPHLPIAYGLRGPSMGMSTMQKMLNDVRNELKKRNTSVHFVRYTMDNSTKLLWNRKVESH